MAAGATYEPIATQTLGSTASSITFSSIPQGYTDLILVVSASLDTTSDLRFRINNDTATNYSFTLLTGDGTSATSTRGTNLTSGLGTYYGQITTTLGNSVQILQFLNYSNTTTFKSIISRANGANGGVDAIINLYRDTAAITNLTLAKSSTMGGTWQSGSTFTLYGISAA